MNRWTTSLALASVIVGVFAPMTGVAERITKDEAVARALAAHPQLAAQDARHEAALQQAALDALSPPWRVALDVENAFGTGAVSGLSGAEISLRGLLTYERGAKALLRGERGSALAEVESVRRLALQADVQHSAVHRYLAVSAEQERLRLRRAELVTAQALQDSVAERSARGVATPADEALVEIALARATLDVEHSEHELKSARRALSALWLGSNDVTASETLEPLPPLPSAVEPVAATLLAARREVLDAERRLAEAAALPDIEFGLGVRRLEALDDQALVFSASLPLGLAPRRTLIGARIDAEERALEAQSQALDVERAQQLFALEQELGHAAREHRGIVERLLPSAERAVAHQRRAYERAALPLSALLQSQQQLQELNGERLGAAYRYHRLLADFERRAVGDSL